LLSGLDPRPVPAAQNRGSPEWEQSWKRFNDEERERLAPRVHGILDRLRLSDNLPDHVLFLLPGESSYLSSLVKGEMNSRWQGKAHMQTMDGIGFGGSGVTYFNGTVLTNALVVVRVSGFLPLRANMLRRLELSQASNTNSPTYDPERLRALRARPPDRIISSEAIKPVSDVANSFGPHPLEFLVNIFDVDQLRVLQEVDKLEVFEIKRGTHGKPLPAGSSTIEGYEMVAQGKTLGQESARKLSMALRPI